MSRASAVSLLVLVLAMLCPIAHADCDFDNFRHFQLSTPESHVETGYTWNMTGQLSIAGGCTIINAPGTTPQEGNPFTVWIDWGDGQSSPLTIGARGVTSASHTYLIPSPPEKPYMPHAYAHVYAAAGRGQFWETVTNYCQEFSSESPYGRQKGCDVSYPVSINVHKRLRTTGAFVPPTLTQGTVATGALTILLEASAPKSGTSLEISSSNPNVKIVVPGGVTAKTVTFVMSPGLASADLDIEVGPAGGEDVTFTIQNSELSVGTKTAGPIHISKKGQL